MIAPKNGLCPFHTRTVGRGIHARVEDVLIELENYSVEEKDGSISQGKHCPRCHAVFNGKK